MNEVQIAWLAGLLEGEGCFFFRRTAYVKLSMTDRDTVEKAAILMDGRTVMAQKLPSRKQVYKVEICASRALGVMELILPHMGQRRSEKINSVIAACAARPGGHWGEKSGSSKLTDVQAEEIRKVFVKYKKGKGIGSGIGKPDSASALAIKYGVSPQAIFYAVNTRKNSDGSRPTV
jgi:hypothetical protein